MRAHRDSYTRLASSIYHWEDPILTGYLFWTLLMFVTILVIVINVTPWLILLRAVGILLLGPHMYFVGRYQCRKMFEEVMTEERYQMASESEAKCIFDEAYKVELAPLEERERRQAMAVSKAIQKRSVQAKHDAEREQILVAAAYLETVPGMRSFADKYRSLPLMESSCSVELPPLQRPRPSNEMQEPRMSSRTGVELV